MQYKHTYKWIYIYKIHTIYVLQYLEIRGVWNAFFVFISFFAVGAVLVRNWRLYAYRFLWRSVSYVSSWGQLSSAVWSDVELKHLDLVWVTQMLRNMRSSRASVLNLEAVYSTVVSCSIKFVILHFTVDFSSNLAFKTATAAENRLDGFQNYGWFVSVFCNPCW